METQIITTIDFRAIPTALKILASGGLVAFPTDTVYGVGGDAFNPQAIERIYKVKERPREKALPILLGDVVHLAEITPPLGRQAQRLVDVFWPGPLTLVLPARHTLPPQLSPSPTVGARIPDHGDTLSLLRASGSLAVTSANLSGQKSPRTAQEVLDQLGGRIELILDGGRTPGGEPSTVVDCTSSDLKVLREGPILLEEILDVIKA